ncbi:MAG: helix-turn-helix domain-containing protein [Candidatus Cloacimonetes bacterium]|nr:helix-turn-helix domain-containing protein [Candidatus Cloacimonadota bacterium]MCF7814604.1 helix-turn-helix domain-containing protein [Candidatus Cloacimonadota bacterium]MCF7869084.1 helix-turn-helix domain-containing protein [Candidatus Cloacimonadota bacterium]MCF7884501.1 helix-turn-helix domain-containing protein [Candidatus Cloacimonadota bacterium]
MCESTVKGMLVSISQRLENIQIQMDEIKKQLECGQQEFVNMEAMAKIAGIPLSTAYQISCRNILPKFRMGKRVLFKRKDVLEMIEKTRVASTSEIQHQAINDVMMEDNHEK